jgi:LacI family transcriptional regulator
VVNDAASVSPAVRERVRQVIQTTGYHPHAAARTLASQRSWTIGLILPHSVSFLFTDPYYPHLIKGISQACNQYDYTLALFLVNDKSDEERIFSRVSRGGFLDGVLVQSGHHGDQRIIGQLIDAGVPSVVVGRPFRSDNISYIDIDNVAAAYDAVHYLTGLGYRRVATIGGPSESTVGIDRKAGYLKALAEAGMDADEALTTEGDFTEAGGYRAMQRLLPARPDAVFVASDIMAIGAIRAAREGGLRVPEDVAFVGFDDLPFATLADIQLTTVHQPVEGFGAKGVELLLDLIEHGTDPPRHVILGTELVVRDSCGAKLKGRA